MKYPVRLFLGNEEVEFSTPPAILFNYSETELTNPTIVKNSYSKTITIEGTQQNNRIFGHIYNMERMQAYNGSVMGSSFNPLVKTDFTLYYNGSIYESGYFKLDEVRRNDNNIEYDITLYGGLGDFFYNLSFREDGNAMELSDLDYECELTEDLGFTVNKENVAEAWDLSWRPGGRWGTINFAPCYNGIPKNLSADKVLINNSGTTDFRSSSTSFPSYQRYSMGTTNEELTEWETFDLRSYLQRPVLRVKEVIGACCNPLNNGGYTINLDEDFFNTTNPYYWDSWMTLPLLTELDVPATVSSALTVTAITKEQEFLYNVYSGMANATNVSFDMGLKFTPSDGYSGNSVYLLRDYRANGGTTLQSRFVKKFTYESFYMVQLLGYNSSGQIGASSEMYRLITPPEGDYSIKDPTWQIDKFEECAPETTVDATKTLVGKFTKVNGEYIFTDMEDNEQTLHFTFPSDAEFTSIKLKIVPYFTEEMSRTWQGGSSSLKGTNAVRFWSKIHTYSNTWQDEHIVPDLDRVQGTVSYVPKGATGTTETFDGFYTGRYYSKKDLLTLGVSPAQFLLSYAKLYGLYFVKDVESKTINVLTRHNFYKRDEIVNINDLVDKGSDIKITPASPKYQYYDFALEQVESEAGKQYKDTYGNDYGAAIVNTGYQYEKEHKKVLDDNIFKGAINVLEKDKYYLKPYFYTNLGVWHGGPTYINNVFSYWYYNSASITSNQEHTRDSNVMTGQTLNPDGLRFYDLFPKPQFHDAENQATDGSFVLLFWNYFVDATGVGYHLTDDTEKMYTLNDGKPCWIMTNGTTDGDGNTIALNVTQIPIFTRDIYNDNYISNSFDLGSPLTTYVPNKYVSDWQNIYSKGWKSYISDLFNVNTRVLTCRCLLRERPNPEWLRRFYWFDNSYWRLNNIRDWNISSFDTTEMEFIKVQDIANYDNVQFSQFATIEWRLDAKYLGQVDDITVRYSIGSGATTVTGFIYDSDGTGFVIGQDGITAEYSNGSSEEYIASDIVNPTYARGASNVPVTLTIPANPSGLTRTFYITLEDNYDKFHNLELVQDAKEIIITDLGLDIIEGGNIIISEDGQVHGASTLYISTDGEDWEAISIPERTQATGTTLYTMSVSSGDSVYFKRNETTKASITLSGSTASFNVKGDITSLTGYALPDNAYYTLFANTKVVNASALLLPSTTSTSCYRDMFSGCASLVSTPILPAASVGMYSYRGMFEGCTSLVNAPLLPAENISGQSYYRMFYGCTSLTAAPALPATTLYDYCYAYMFYGCTSLTTAPDLFAPVIADASYTHMFENCTSLNYVKCLATTVPAYSTYYWLRNVASTGTFVKKTSMTDWSTGVSGIPSGWTVENDEPVWSAYFNFTYGDVTFPQSGMWDNYIIYSGATMDPIEDGGAIIMFNGGIIVQAGDTWNPASATGWEVYSPFSEKQQYDQVYIPQSLAGQTIYLMAEFGSADVGYALESQAIPVTIPQNGGQVNVTIPQF